MDGIFEQHGSPERVLHFVDMLGDAGQGFVGVGQGQEVVEERALVRRPRQVLGNESRLEALGDRREPLKMGAVERPGRADRQADAMQRQRIAFPDRVEAAMRRAAAAHVVFRVNFEKSKLGTGVDDRLEMLGLEPDADALRAKRLRRTMIRDGHGLLQGHVSRWDGIGDFAHAPGHVTSASIRASSKIFPRICNGRRNETKPV